MSNIFFSSDLHLGHENFLTFVDDDGNLIRPFSSVEEMDEMIIERHNKVVGPSDKWYCLGDLGFDMPNLEAKLSRMNGKKRLILGNHDYPRKRDFEMYFRHFEKVMESRRIGNVLFTHRPVYLGPHEVKIAANVHGHIHERVLPDDRYLNISVEQINYTPVSIDWIIKTLNDRGFDISVS